ncbi:MAG: dihydroneopterin aldolase [Prochlorococcaceae cyanobacterium]
MTPECPVPEAIHVRGLRLWAHVGVLEAERELGQWFDLEFSLWADLGAAGRSDDLSLSYDYAQAIAALQELAAGLRCLTLEHFAERALDALEQLYGPLPLRVQVIKCRAPVSGFGGSVAIERFRRVAR